MPFAKSAKATPTYFRARSGALSLMSMNLLPVESERSVVCVTIALILVVVILLLSGIESDALDIIASAVTTVMAAFWGAKYAFSLQNKKDYEAEIGRRIEAANKAIFALINVHNKLCNYRDQFVNEFRESPFRHLGILPAVGMGEYKEINVDSLSFVIEHDKRNILLELALFQAEAFATFNIIGERSRYHVEKVQETLEAAGFGATDYAHIDDLNAALGPLKTTTIKKYTDQMIESTDNAIAQSSDLIDRLRTVFKEMFPGRVIIGMEKLNKPLQSDQNK